jgi:hypothetical protein
MAVAEGLGGEVLNSNEAENEAGCHWQHADWCDYSGPVPLLGPFREAIPEGILPSGIAGIACFNHPANSPADTIWHVRDDGWMGACLTFDGRATRANVASALTALIGEARPGDSLVFTFSGHGSWLPDESGDEPDGRDEMLCPHDVSRGQYLMDDALAPDKVSGPRYNAAIMATVDR